MSVKILRAPFMGFGNKKTSEGIYFSCILDFVREGGIVFYEKSSLKEKLKISFESDYGYGNVFCVYVSGISSDIVYRYYTESSEFTDKYAPVYFKDTEYGLARSESDYYSAIEEDISIEGFENDKFPLTPYCDSTFYLAHVRGLTMLDKSVKHKGTFLGLQEKIDYFKELNITGLILMPCYEFNECVKADSNNIADAILNYKQDLNEKPPVDFWGFRKGFYFSLKSAYSFSKKPNLEFKNTVYKFHQNNIEIILTMFFPKDTGEELIMAVLRHYVMNYHVDGFRILGNDINKDLIVSDPFMQNTKLLLEDDDLSRFYKEKPLKYKNLALYSPYSRDKLRSFIKGDEDNVSSVSYFIRENNKTYEPLRYITDYYGFTLRDIYTYNFKHNEANKESNTDGNNYNFSWNCGTEGETKKSAIMKLRLKMQKNALLSMLLCQGAPVISGGDEWLNTNNGNNNPWCQDNEDGWVIYSNTKNSKEFFEFTKDLISFRKRHVVLHQPKELRLLDYMSCKLPDVSFHSDLAFKMNQDPVSRSFAVLFAGDYAKQYTGKPEDSIFIVFNMYWESVDFVLPMKDKNFTWYKLFCSDGSTLQDFDEKKADKYDEDHYKAPERTVSIFLLRKHESD